MDENDLAYTQHDCRYWSMLITQIPCSSAMLHTASPGCRQYLTGVTGTLQSFNFANTNNPQLLQGQGTWHTRQLGILALCWLLAANVEKLLCLRPESDANAAVHCKL